MPADTFIRLGSRASALARTQTGWVAERMMAAGADVRIETISTQGDARQDIPVARIGGDGVFVRELEQALLEGRIDAAVHSLKDMPTATTPGLVIASIPERATCFDAVVGRTAGTLADLPPGAVVGTSSIRRIAQVLAIRSDLLVKPLRGNVDTRLRRLDAGDYDALILAAAGLERLGLAGRITHLLRPPAFWPAVSQGALAVQVRADDRRARDAVAVLDHPVTHAAVIAERRMLADLAAGCLAPVGGWARLHDDTRMTLGGCVLEVDLVSRVARRVVAEATVAVSTLAGRGLDRAELSLTRAMESLGASVAADLRARGADTMLERMRTSAG
jgi:hydroxymethylbilane synthase